MDGIINTSLFFLEIRENSSKATIVIISGWYKALECSSIPDPSERGDKCFMVFITFSQWNPIVIRCICYRLKPSFWNYASLFEWCFWSEFFLIAIFTKRQGRSLVKIFTKLHKYFLFKFKLKTFNSSFWAINIELNFVFMSKKISY